MPDMLSTGNVEVDKNLSFLSYLRVKKYVYNGFRPPDLELNAAKLISCHGHGKVSIYINGGQTLAVNRYVHFGN